MNTQDLTNKELIELMDGVKITARPLHLYRTSQTGELLEYSIADVLDEAARRV